MKFLTENIFLIAIAFVSGAMLVWPLVRRGAAGASVGTLEATMLINQKDAIVIDVREPGEFAQTHILNSRNVPLGEIEARIKELERFKDKPVIVSCATGNRSGSAASVLRKHGFTNVVNLAGGVAAWQQAGLPTGK
ncbi:MAG TPA: rhodanese-like domain-containing protein [Burkholderiales bacterium]|jgi:rhodanese-related sulfurtransferase|nr:rhodanese-like domain-containing protein [Burkholderiales bacterium]